MMSETSTTQNTSISTLTPVVDTSQNAIIIGVCLALVVLLSLVVIAACIWRKRCRSELILENEAPALKPPDVNDVVVTATSPPQMYTRLTMGSINAKFKVARSHSNPNPGSRHGPRVGTSHESKPRPAYVNADHCREHSIGRGQHQLVVLDEAVRNAETVDKGGTAEANHRYITRITLIPPASACNYMYSSQPISRVDSVTRPSLQCILPRVPVRRMHSVYDGQALHARQAGRRVVSSSRSSRACVGPL